MFERPQNDPRPVIGISVGDLNGIGPEVIIKALTSHAMNKYFVPVIFGSSKLFSFYKKHLQQEDFSFHQINEGQTLHPRKINVFNVWKDNVEVQPGKVTPQGGQYAFESLESAVQHLQQQRIDALVTAPINKHNIQREDFTFAGHTEYLTNRFEVQDTLMLMCTAQGLRVGVVTGHLPLQEVPAAITAERVTRKFTLLENSLKKDFGLQKPRIALLGLNPHAGEAGLLGQEEQQVLQPLLEQWRQEGKLVYGPFPADGFFGQGMAHKFDATLAMYHDQGLIPFKTLAFEDGVNFTAGLPIIRTSPDHGTAYDIAGKGVANAHSMKEALFMAYDIYKNHSLIGTPSVA